MSNILWWVWVRILFPFSIVRVLIKKDTTRYSFEHDGREWQGYIGRWRKWYYCYFVGWQGRYEYKTKVYFEKYTRWFRSKPVPTDYFTLARKRKGMDIHGSPEKKYVLSVENYKTGKGTWDMTLGKVYTAHAPVKLIATIKRNYSSFWHGFIENYEGDGHDYLLCGENYQGLTIIQLDTGQRTDYVPKGGGFCHTEFLGEWVPAEWQQCSPDISFEGCYWGCPYEVVTYDFTNPMELPWPEESRSWVDDDLNDYDEDDEDDE